MYLYKEWYVEKGSYRLKLTHTAFDSSGKAVETVINIVRLSLIKRLIYPWLHRLW